MVIVCFKELGVDELSEVDELNALPAPKVKDDTVFSSADCVN